MEYGAKIPSLAALAAVFVATHVASVTPAFAEHSSGFSPFGAGFPGSEPPTPPVVNDGRALSLPSNPALTKPKPSSATLPSAVDGNEFRITGATVANRASATPTNVSPFDQGYNPPTRGAMPSKLSLRSGFIGLSRVPQGAL